MKSSVFFDMVMREITTKGDGRKQRIQATRRRKAWNNLIERHVVPKIDRPTMSRRVIGGGYRLHGLMALVVTTISVCNEGWRADPTHCDLGKGYKHQKSMSVTCHVG